MAYPEAFTAISLPGAASQRRRMRRSRGCPCSGDLVIRVTMSEIRSLAEVKAHLSELVARVGAQHDRVTVTVHGRPAAMLVAVDDIESMEETIAVLSDRSAVRALVEAEAEVARGEGEDEASLERAMRARRATA